MDPVLPSGVMLVDDDGDQDWYAGWDSAYAEPPPIELQEFIDPRNLIPIESSS